MSFTEKLTNLIKSTEYDVVIYNCKTKELNIKYTSIKNYCLAWLIAQYAMNSDRKDDNEFVFITPGKNAGIVNGKNTKLYETAKKLANRYRNS